MLIVLYTDFLKYSNLEWTKCLENNKENVFIALYFKSYLERLELEGPEGS